MSQLDRKGNKQVCKIHDGTNYFLKYWIIFFLDKSSFADELLISYSV